jgi:hypothetical protein
MFWEFSEKGIVFFPDPHLIGTPRDLGLEYEDAWFEAEDGVKLHGWWVPKPGAPVLLWFHGNAGNISHRLENIKLLVDEVGVGVFIFDYREYGWSEGPSRTRPRRTGISPRPGAYPARILSCSAAPWARPWPPTWP